MRGEVVEPEKELKIGLVIIGVSVVVSAINIVIIALRLKGVL